jgi:hypothetical protein
MDDTDKPIAGPILYAIAVAAGFKAAESDGNAFVYDEDRDVFTFPDGRFAFDRERADPWLARAFRLLS